MLRNRLMSATFTLYARSCTAAVRILLWIWVHDGFVRPRTPLLSDSVKEIASILSEWIWRASAAQCAGKFIRFAAWFELSTPTAISKHDLMCRRHGVCSVHCAVTADRAVPGTDVARRAPLRLLSQPQQPTYTQLLLLVKLGSYHCHWTTLSLLHSCGCITEWMNKF